MEESKSCEAPVGPAAHLRGVSVSVSAAEGLPLPIGLGMLANLRHGWLDHLDRADKDGGREEEGGMIPEMGSLVRLAPGQIFVIKLRSKGG